MKLEVDHTEITTLLENNVNICNAMIGVSKTAHVDPKLDTEEFLKAVVEVIEAVERSQQLILQAVKSNTAVLNQIRERNLPGDGGWVVPG